MPWCQERGSCQMFFKNVGQMIQDQTPNAIKNAEIRRDNTMESIIPTLKTPGSATSSDDDALRRPAIGVHVYATDRA